LHLLPVLLVVRGDDEVEAAIREVERDLLADATVRAGDEGAAVARKHLTVRCGV